MAFQVKSHEPILLIISGPAGSGKTTLCDRLLAEHSSVCRMVTTTSRDPREGEIDGVDYHFLPPDDFKKGIDQGEFLEWALVHGRYYGSQKKHVQERLNEGKDILFNIDVQGADTFREKVNQDPDLKGKVRSVFIKLNFPKQIRERLDQRGTDDEAEIQRRIASAEKEMEEAHKFDFIIESGTKDEDYQGLESYYLSLHAL